MSKEFASAVLQLAKYSGNIGENLKATIEDYSILADCFGVRGRERMSYMRFVLVDDAKYWFTENILSQNLSFEEACVELYRRYNSVAAQEWGRRQLGTMRPDNQNLDFADRLEVLEEILSNIDRYWWRVEGIVHRTDREKFKRLYLMQAFESVFGPQQLNVSGTRGREPTYADYTAALFSEVLRSER